jgi:hypothetical protein
MDRLKHTAVRSSEKGVQFGTEVLKHGKHPSVLFQKEWPWVSDVRAKFIIEHISRYL